MGSSTGLKNRTIEFVCEDEFRKMINKRASSLLEMARYIVLHSPIENGLTRLFMGTILNQSTALVELLDGYGAQNNQKWSKFRLMTSAFKRFSNAGYELMHIQHYAPLYKLLPIDKDFEFATEEAVRFTAEIIENVAVGFLDQAKRLSLDIPTECPNQDAFTEVLPDGMLAQDVQSRKIESVSKTVAQLATAFLNLSADSHLIHTAAKADPSTYRSYIPDPISEKELRYLEQKFHNLQSLYDTYVLVTEIEGLDAGLPVLRGHISVVFHLLKTATEFVHYYERHITGKFGGVGEEDRNALVKPDKLLHMLMNYSLAFASAYIECARSLCQEMLRRYAEVGEIRVSVPRYRGFHVRPSTLVAKIVMHYGNEVKLCIDGETFDASSPLDIFRVNEKVNARKRKWLAQEISNIDFVHDPCSYDDIKDLVRKVIVTLAGEGKVMIYEQPLGISDICKCKSISVAMQAVVEEVARLQATGKIDIVADLMVNFIGDKRVLDDIKILAQNDYGEDSFGNNTALPRELSYLCHSRLTRSDVMG